MNFEQPHRKKFSPDLSRSAKLGDMVLLLDTDSHGPLDQLAKDRIRKNLNRLDSLEVEDKDYAKLAEDNRFTGDNIFNGDVQVTGDLDVNNIDFDLTPSNGQAEGRLVWNPDENTLNLGMTGGVVNLQIGQELLIRATNEEVDQISNGDLVYISGGSGANVLVKRADQTFQATPIGMATEDIAASQKGYVTTAGLVRDVNTNGMAAGQPVWLGTDGAFTTTRPTAPITATVVGVVIRSHANQGVIYVAIDKVQSLSLLSDVQVTDIANEDVLMWDSGDARWENVPMGRHLHFYNGSMLESFTFEVTEDGGVVTGTLDNANSPGSDLTARLSDGYTAIPGGGVVLEAGTDSAPRVQYVYIPIATKLLTVSTVDWPVTEHIKIATVSLRTAARTGTEGALVNANWNDHSGLTADSMGHSLHIGERIRQSFGSWSSGTEASLTITLVSPSVVRLAVTAGKVFQMHKQDFDAIDTGAGGDVHVVNDSVSPYLTITNLEDIDTDASGGTLSNKHFTLVVWGVNNSGSEQDHIMINLPTDSYNSSASAIADGLGYNVYSIPPAYKNTGFLIGQFTIYRTPSGTWTENNYVDLRGITPNSSAGSATGSSGITTFLGLTDTPSAYTGFGWGIPVSNFGETALELTRVYINNSLTNPLMGIGRQPTGSPTRVNFDVYNTDRDAIINFESYTDNVQINVRAGTDIGGLEAAEINWYQGAFHRWATGMNTSGHYYMADMTAGWTVLSAVTSDYTKLSASTYLWLEPDAGIIDIQAPAGYEVLLNWDKFDVDFRVMSDDLDYAFMVRGSDGNVGIGRDPTQLLDVYSTGNTRILIESSSASAYPELKIKNATQTWDLYVSSTAGTLVFRDSTATLYPIQIAQATPSRALILSSSEVIINDNGSDLDFRVESDTKTHALFVQGSDGNIGMGVVPTDHLHIHEASSAKAYIRLTNTTTGSAVSNGYMIGLGASEECYVWNYEETSLIFGQGGSTRTTYDNAGVTFNSPGNDYDFIVESDTLTNALKVDGGTGAVSTEGLFEVGTFLDLGLESELTISSGGAITVTGTLHNVDTYADAASDNLDNIYGGQAGVILVLRANNSSRTVTLREGVGGNLRLAGNFVMDSDNDHIVLLQISGLWLELSRSNNA